MAMSQVQAVGLAMARLKRGVVICCWAAMLALLTQTVVWSLAVFTDARYDDASQLAGAEHSGTAIVRREDGRKGGPLRAPGASADASESHSPKTDPIDEARPLSRHDDRFRTAVNISAIAATLAVLAMLPLLAVGIVLAAGAAAPGVEKTVSALALALLVAALVLPIARLSGVESFSGTISGYDSMIAAVEAARQADTAQALESMVAVEGKGADKTGAVKTSERISAGKPAAKGDAAHAGDHQAVGDAADDLLASAGGAEFYLRYLLLPLTCIIGLALIALRFSAGVEAAIIRIDYRLDPALEREAANIKASSLHGSGRSTAALGGTMAGAPAAPPAPPSAMQVSPGVAPRRII